MFIYVVFSYDPVKVMKVCFYEADALLMVDKLCELYPQVIWDWRALNVETALVNLTGIC